MFFHPEGERGPARRNRDQAAKAVCRTCPVLTQCRAHALAVREPYGVWGGLSEEDRDAIYAAPARSPGRPGPTPGRGGGARPARGGGGFSAPERGENLGAQWPCPWP